MSILRDLWNGNIAPCETPVSQKLEYNLARSEVMKQHALLLSSLSDEQKKLLQLYSDQLDKMIWLELEDAFTKGVRLGAQFLLSVIP